MLPTSAVRSAYVSYGLIDGSWLRIRGCDSLHAIPGLTVQPRRSASRFPRKRFPIYTRFQNAMEAFGVSTEKVVADARLSPWIVEQENPSVDTDELLRIYSTLEAMIGVDAVVTTLRGFGEKGLMPPFLAAMSCPDLRSGIRRYAECKRLCGPMEISLESTGETAALTFDWLVPLERITPSLVIGCAAAVLDIAERGSGQRILPVRAEAANAADVPVSLAEKHLGVPLQRGPKMRLFFNDRDLETPFQTRNPFTLKLLDRFFADAIAEHLPAASRADAIRESLRRLLPSGIFDLTAVARDLGTSTRQIQRELAAEDTSFKDVLRDIRRELALYYLARPAYSPKEVTCLLGYSEPAAFHRALRHWTGTTPAEYAALSRERTARPR